MATLVDPHAVVNKKNVSHETRNFSCCHSESTVWQSALSVETFISKDILEYQVKF
jgi:hypothetical protein